MSFDLRKATIRLAKANPVLRPHLLPILKESADFDPEEIGEQEPGALEHDSDEPYQGKHHTQVEFTELSDKQEAGDLPSEDANKQAADETALRRATIRLAHQKPHLQKYLLPLLKD